MSIPSYTAPEPRGMNGSQEGHMRAHFRQRNISSASLEGMERPVRSFKSFVQTAPPNPTDTDKALPLTPAPWDRADSDRARTPTPPSVDFPPLSKERVSRTASWKAPAEWYDNSPSGRSTHTPSPVLTPVTSAPRFFSPLLPEPSPPLYGMSESTTWPTSSSPPPVNRLLPIYERRGDSPDYGPPGTPPRTPLPATPPSDNRYIENILPPELERANSPRSREVVGANARVQTIFQSESTKEKAYASLGLELPSKLSRDGKRPDREYLRGKKIRALQKGNPLADDSWEDEDMDDMTRALSFSQDYHDLLADQYQELSVRKEEVLNSGGAQQVYEAQIYEARFVESMHSIPPQDREVVPTPLTWRKSPAPSTPRSHSRDGVTEQPSSPGQKSKHKRLSSLFNHHIGTYDSSREDLSKKERRPSKSNRNHETQGDKAPEDDLRFSKFFPSKRPVKLGKKQKKTTAAKAPSASSSPPQPSPMFRLPGGLAVVRNHSPSPSPRSDVLSNKSPTSTHTRGSSQNGSDYSHTTSNPCYPYQSNESPTANMPIAMRSAHRTSGGSSYSHHSNTGHPLVLEASPPPPPPPPLVLSSSLPLSPPLSPETLNRNRSQEKDAEHHRYKPNFIEKAREARRRRLTEARQDRLKRSIKVLGPTDPGVAQAGYVKSEERFAQSESDLEGRLPGYMAGGPA